MAEPSRILIVDDEPSITDLLSMALRYEGMEVSVSHLGRDALEAMTSFRPHLVVLDVMLPDLSGFDVLERMGRDRIGGRLPVLFLTARDTLDDKLRGFTLGGDDYMTKPFSVEELIVRVRAILRRAHGEGDDGRMSVSDLRLDEESHEVHRGSAPSSSPPPSSSSCTTSCSTPAGWCRSRRSSTGCGTTTSTATPTWSRSTSAICARRSTPSAPASSTPCAVWATRMRPSPE